MDRVKLGAIGMGLAVGFVLICDNAGPMLQWAGDALGRIAALF